MKIAKLKHLQIWLEVISYVGSIFLIALILLPVIQKTIDFPYLLANAVLIFLAIHITKYFFLLPHTFWAKIKGLKKLVVITTPIIVFLIIEKISNYQNYADETGLLPHIEHLPFEEQQPIFNYIQTEYVFFGVAAVIAMVLFCFRLILSLWRNRNTGKS